MAEPLGAGYRIAVGVLRPLLMVLTRRDWHGAENLPRTGGFVIAPNHVSHVDPIVFAHFLVDNRRPPRFLAKSGLFTVPVVGWIVRSAGQIPVFRESRDAAAAFSGAVKAIEAGECVAIYPEGTLTRDPDLWPMVAKTGAARVALTTGCPVIPVAQWGPQQILRPYTKRPHLLGRPVMHVTAGPPVDLDDLRGRPITSELLKVATERIMARVTAQLVEIRGEVAPAKAFDLRVAGLSATGRPEPVGGRGKPPTDRRELPAAAADAGADVDGVELAQAADPVAGEDVVLADGATADGVPSDGVPADGVPADGVLADGVLADGATADGASSDVVRADSVLVDGSPADGSSADEDATSAPDPTRPGSTP